MPPLARLLSRNQYAPRRNTYSIVRSRLRVKWEWYASKANRQIRNPKSEARRKSENRSPKANLKACRKKAKRV